MAVVNRTAVPSRVVIGRVTPLSALKRSLGVQRGIDNLTIAPVVLVTSKMFFEVRPDRS